MAMTFAEAFIRGYAERAVKAIEVTCDRNAGVTLLSFHGRHQQVNMRDLVLQEDAFRRLGNAVNALLGIPEQPEPRDEGEPIEVSQIPPTERAT